MPSAKRLISGLPFYACLLLLAYMPFHVFITQYASLATGGLQAWKIAKDIVVALLTLFVICLVWRGKMLDKTFKQLLGLTVAYAALHLIMWLIHPHIYRTSALIGLTYNLRLPCFALIGYGANLLRPDLLKWDKITKWLLVVSSIIAGIGVVQYFLPSDILTHFGYSVARGARPAFFIDNNPAFPRVMSTLRDPNSLAAYLIPSISLLYLFVLRSRVWQQRILYSGLLVLHSVCFWLTYSRSALLALVLAVAVATYFENYKRFSALLRRFWLLGLVVISVITLGGIFAMHHNSHLNGVITHTTTQQVGQYDSNQFHWLYVKRGLEGIWHDPLGHGPGTAGLASIQNPQGGFLTENYYVQVGYEVGVIGLAVFIALNVWLVQRLWRTSTQTKDDGPLALSKTSPLNSHRVKHLTTRLFPAELSQLVALGLLATAVAYIVMNMLLHTWSNEAVACQWWLVAGLLLADKKTVVS